MSIDQLRAALNETQMELRDTAAQIRSLPWLIGALKHIAKDPCEKGLDRDLASLAQCNCHTCVARGGLKRFLDRRSVPPPELLG